MKERADGLGLSCVIEADGELVGTCGLYLRGGRLGPEIGYTIAPWARRKGYAAEAAHGLADWGLSLGAPRVHLFVDVRNTASHATARAGGVHAGGDGAGVSGVPGRLPGRRGALRAAARRLTRRCGRARRSAPSRPGQACAAASCDPVCAACAGPAPFSGRSVSRMRP